MIACISKRDDAALQGSNMKAQQRRDSLRPLSTTQPWRRGLLLSLRAGKEPQRSAKPERRKSAARQERGLRWHFWEAFAQRDDVVLFGINIMKFLTAMTLSQIFLISVCIKDTPHNRAKTTIRSVYNARLLKIRALNDPVCAPINSFNQPQDGCERDTDLQAQTVCSCADAVFLCLGIGFS